MVLHLRTRQIFQIIFCFLLPQVDIFMNGEHVETVSPSVPDEQPMAPDSETRTHDAVPKIRKFEKLFEFKGWLSLTTELRA